MRLLYAVREQDYGDLEKQIRSLVGKHDGLRETMATTPTSYNTCFAYFMPAMSSQRTLGDRSSTLSTTLDS